MDNARIDNAGELSRIDLFRDLAPEQLEQLRSHLHYRRFSAGANILTVEQPGEATYVILTGTVKIHVEQADGSDVILAIRGPGEILGEMSILDSLGHSASVVTMEDCHLCWLDRVTFKNYLQSTPVMAYNLACILARRLRIASVQIQALSSMDVYGRVSRQLLAFANEFGEHDAANGDIRIPLRLTQPDLASLVGASRVRVNQVIGFYKRHKYITIDHEHRITIHNAAALAKRC